MTDTIISAIGETTLNQECKIINVLPSQDKFPNRYNFSDDETMPEHVIIIIQPGGFGIVKLLKPKNRNSKLTLTFIGLDPKKTGKIIIEDEDAYHFDTTNQLYEKPGYYIYSKSQTNTCHVKNDQWFMDDGCNDVFRTENIYSNTRDNLQNIGKNYPIFDTYNFSGIYKPIKINEEFESFMDWEKISKLPLTELFIEKYICYLRFYLDNLNKRFVRPIFIEKLIQKYQIKTSVDSKKNGSEENDFQVI